MLMTDCGECTAVCVCVCILVILSTALIIHKHSSHCWWWWRFVSSGTLTPLVNTLIFLPSVCLRIHLHKSHVDKMNVNSAIISAVLSFTCICFTKFVIDVFDIEHYICSGFIGCMLCVHKVGHTWWWSRGSYWYLFGAKKSCSQESLLEYLGNQ